MPEVRNRREGTLRWVQASGSGLSWATASGAATALLGFVRNFTWTSARTVQVISDRGTPSHHKVVAAEPINGSFDIAWANTAQFPNPSTGSGATVPMVHLELKMTAPEAGAAYYYQFHGVNLTQTQFTEGDQENMLSYQFQALAMNGPTASGYLG